MKTNYISMCFAAAVFLLIGCGEKPETETGEKAASPAAVEKAPGTEQGVAPAPVEAPGAAVSEPATGTLEAVPNPEGGVPEDTDSDEPVGTDASEGSDANVDPMATPAPTPAPEPVE
ncbi:MAG: hypothetical protein L0Y38_06225 [Methylococcaceae bacterium]|nr:hypothetical protein [Methylococcaceae bacterium]